MRELDRSAVIQLLERLGAKDDETVLAAARELHACVSEAGASWDELLEPDPDAHQEEMDVDEDPDDVEIEEAMAAANEALVPADLEEDIKIIDRLLAKKSVSADTRAELSDLKEDIAAGEYTAMDSRYVRALAQRLNG